jgi:hypothetical protein
MGLPCADRPSFRGRLVRLAAKAAGKDPKEVKIVHYDPKKADVDVKKAFPFRNVVSGGALSCYICAAVSALSDAPPFHALERRVCK